MLTAFCTFLEEMSGEFAQRAFPSDFEERAKKKMGSLFAKYIKVLVDGGAFDATPVQEDIEKFGALIKLRNCVVHAWGKVSRASDPEAVREAIAMVESAGTYKDGFLGFGDQVLPEAIIAAENIGDALIDQLLPETCVLKERSHGEEQAAEQDQDEEAEKGQAFRNGEDHATHRPSMEGI